MICERCGFEYKSAKCPVCEAEVQPAHIEKKKSKLGLIGMILAICSFAIQFVVAGVPDFPFAIAGLVCSVTAKKKNKEDGYATAGLIVSIAKICLTVLTIISGIFGAVLSLIYIGYNMIVTFSTILQYFSNILEIFQSLMGSL